MLFTRRLQSDFDRCAEGMRKACNYREGLLKHQCCAVFLHFLGRLQRVSPPAEFKLAEESLEQQFLQGLLDFDLQHAVESQVPPGDMSAVAAFRSFVAQVENATRLAKEKKDEALAAELRVSDLKNVLAKLDSDFNELQARQGTAQSQAIETAKDLKYVHDRSKILDCLFIFML